MPDYLNISDSYSAPSNWLVYKFSIKSNEILILRPFFSQIFILRFFKLLAFKPLRSNVTCSPLLLTGDSWLFSCYWWYLVVTSSCLFTTTGYFSLLQVTCGYFSFRPVLLVTTITRTLLKLNSKLCSYSVCTRSDVNFSTFINKRHS